ncbi:MAG: chemotaxis protein CheW [Parcubacteria group bacterium]
MEQKTTDRDINVMMSKKSNVILEEMKNSPRHVREQEERLEQLIVFRLGEDEFGVRIEEVREIIKAGIITPIPDSPRFIKGIINIRGEVIITIDLRERFFLSPPRDPDELHIVVTREAKNPFGLLVDEVTEVMRLPESNIKDTPGLVTKIHEEYVVGVVVHENRLIILLDLKQVLSEDELVRLADIQREHGADDVEENDEDQEGSINKKKSKKKQKKN